MNLFFSDRPGSHERHLRRKVNNPLFGDLVIDQDTILRARQQDEQELQAFLETFHEIARDASQLDASVDAELLIELKDRLERSYESSCCVMGNQQEIQQALSRLIDSIMNSLLHASLQDEHAHSKLMDEKQARALHFQMLSYPLVADLMRADSPVQSDELMPALLSETEKVVTTAAGLFTADQLVFICEHARNMLQDVTFEHEKITHAREMLALLEQLRDQLLAVEGDQAGSSGRAS